VNVSHSELESDEAENGSSSHSRDGSRPRSLSASEEVSLVPSGEGKTVSGCNSEVELETDHLGISGQATTQEGQTSVQRGQTTTQRGRTSAQKGRTTTQGGRTSARRGRTTTRSSVQRRQASPRGPCQTSAKRARNHSTEKTRLAPRTSPNLS